MDHQTLRGLTDTLVQDYLEFKGGSLVVLVDNRTLGIGRSVTESAAMMDRGGSIFMGNIDDYKRPMTRMPDELKGYVERALAVNRDDATLVYFFHRSPEEQPLAIELRDFGQARGKIGGLPSCTEDFLQDVFDPTHLPQKSQRFGKQLHELLSKEEEFEITCPRGSHLHLQMDPSRFAMINSDGRLVRGFYGNPFPGEVYGHPADAEGSVVITGTYFPLMSAGLFSEKYAELRDALDRTPIYWGFKGGRIVKATCDNAEIEAIMRKQIFEVDPVNGMRLGEIGFPANLYNMGQVSGHLGIDEKRNLHVAHGHGYPKRTGADYDSPVHCDGVIGKGTVRALRSGLTIMTDGQYNAELFSVLRE